MKSWLNKSLLFFVAALTLMSCEKDEEKLVLREGEAPVLNASTNELVLVKEEAADDAITLTWGKADFGYKAAVTYTLQVDTADNNFETPYNIVMGNNLEKKYTVEELNTLLNKLKYEPEVAHDINIRVKASVSDLVNPVYSEPLTLNVTPYSTFVEPGYVFVPGDYQGWNPGAAPALISVNNDGIYKGVIDFSGTNSRKFKITPERDWDTAYGSGASAGTLSTTGPDIEIATNDPYQLEVNLNTLTWTSKKYSWGLIGDATPGGWATDTNMKYIHEEGVWKLTVPLTAGKIKFRLNDDWGVNYGDDDTSNNLLNQGGADISIAEAGTYDIVLDLENADGSVTYTLTKK
ncbi:SusE domain-containing protein [Pontibacter sp. KCTC 32443]|uniref:SusE domain-containing protein n=1 Tax=Pontibacter TaxID=323449 RepID=UPI00164E8AB8|nr:MULTISPECIES: SusE domain-containing protein [Pontibacter]MBC5772750.1 SusE domain-containing protein [Pontibacter sp. KCTC 32443]